MQREFDADVSELANVTAFVEEELERLACSMKTMIQINVCLEEMFVNVAHYAYGEGKGTVKISIEEENDVFSVELVDCGMPFDPLAKEDPDVTLAAEDRKIGGLGIFMVKKSMDEVSYRYEDGKNIFCMKKKLHDEK